MSEKQDISKNMNLSPELLGIAGIANPFPQNCSSQRLTMFSSHLMGRLNLVKAEVPNVFTGFDLLMGDYTFNQFPIESDIKIIKIIPKFRRIELKKNPSITIIYQNLDNDEYDYAEVTKYVNSGENYGFKNNLNKIFSLKEGDILEKGEEIVYPYSKNPETGEYGYGINANIAYMSLLKTYEDAFIISKSLAQRLGIIFIENVDFHINFNRYPLNLYGNEEEYKVFPDIGERVDENGIISAFRKINKNFVLLDFNNFEISKPNSFSDKILVGMPNATIIDIDVYLDKQLKLLKVAYDQFFKYSTYKIEYYQDVYKAYMQIGKSKISYKLNTLFTKAIEYLIAGIDKYKKAELGYSLPSINVKIQKKGSLIYLLTNIQYMYECHADVAFKISDRGGGKGVICQVIDDELMPIDRNGIRADIVMDTASVIKRSNLHQLFEQFINRGSELVVKNVVKNPSISIQKKSKTVLDWIKDINPTYSEVVRSQYTNKELIEELEDNPIKIFVPPAYKLLDINQYKYIKDKWNIKATPVIFYIEDENGNYKQVETKKSVSIGGKYIILLYNIPNVNAVSIGVLNQFRIPTKGAKKKKFGLTITPTRFGEDEQRILLAASNPKESLRLRYLYSSNEEGLLKMIDMLLNSQQPSKIERIPIELEELKRSTILNTINGIFEMTGIDIKHSRIKI